MQIYTSVVLFLRKNRELFSSKSCFRRSSIDTGMYKIFFYSSILLDEYSVRTKFDIQNSLRVYFSNKNT